METSFADRTIAVTGGASGIGLAITRALLSLGATVHVADIAKFPPSEISSEKNLHFSGSCDITQRGTCKKFLDDIPGRLDGLVNCAGICPPEGKIASDETFRKVMDVNVTGTWNMATEALPRMSKQEVRHSSGIFTGVERNVGAGAIVNISSGAGFRGIPGLAAYCASKHAVIGLTRVWAKDFYPVRVNSVAPGVTDTPLFRGVNTHDSGADLLKFLESRVPMGRLGQPTDIADVVLFLLSDASSFMTGQVIPVNGGSDESR